MAGIIVRNTLVTYDRHNEKIGFWKTNCSELWERLHIGGGPSPAPSSDTGSQADMSPAPAPSGLPGLCLIILFFLFNHAYHMMDNRKLILVQL